MKRHMQKGYALPGTRRAQRLRDEWDARGRPRLTRPFSPYKQIQGLKRWTVLTLAGYERITPWAAKEKKKRRRRNKLARLSRRGNR